MICNAADDDVNVGGSATTRVMRRRRRGLILCNHCRRCHRALRGTLSKARRPRSSSTSPRPSCCASTPCRKRRADGGDASLGLMHWSSRGDGDDARPAARAPTWFCDIGTTRATARHPPHDDQVLGGERDYTMIGSGQGRLLPHRGRATNVGDRRRRRGEVLRSPLSLYVHFERTLSTAHRPVLRRHTEPELLLVNANAARRADRPTRRRPDRAGTQWRRRRRHADARRLRRLFRGDVATTRSTATTTRSRPPIGSRRHGAHDL